MAEQRIPEKETKVDSLFSNFIQHISEINFHDSRPFVSINIAGQKFKALLDTGACITAMSLDALKSLSEKPEPVSSSGVKRISVANGNTVQVKGVYRMPITIRRTEILFPMDVIEGLNTPVILGLDFIRKSGIVINGKTNKIAMGSQEIRNELKVN